MSKSSHQPFDRCVDLRSDPRAGESPLTCTVDRVEGIYSCVIRGAERGLGGAALSTWRGDRPVTKTLFAASSQHESIATLAAHRLCKCTQEQAISIVGQIESLQAGPACDLAVRALQQLEGHRLRESVRAPSGLLSRLGSETEAIRRRVAAMMSPPLAQILSEHRETITAGHAEHFRGQVRVFAPLYLCNACLNECSYCGFRKSTSMRREKLSVQQAVEEAHSLVEQGHRAIDLVSGEIPTDAFVDYVSEVTKHVLARTGIRRISLNLGALSTTQLRRLRGAGATAYHLYQETYDPEVYFEVHAGGPKRDMAYRLGGLQRALEAGFEAVGLGILLGLAPVENELAYLTRHARILLEQWPSTQLGFSLPRLRRADAGCHFRPHTPIDDEAFQRAMLFLRLEFPTAHLTLTTREGRELRDRLIPFGITKISAGVSTSPGGYAQSASGDGEQFSINDRRTVIEIVEAIRSAGLNAVYE